MIYFLINNKLFFIHDNNNIFVHFLEKESATMSGNQFEDPKFIKIVDDIVKIIRKSEEKNRRDALICWFIETTMGNPGVIHFDRARIDANILRTFQRAAEILGFADINLPAEAEKYPEKIHQAELHSF
ncbi:MAG: hypothetical protein PHR36_00140 [Patescibacteria group bacterium]|nr:hypothetical protein [Patescibacteria group bacterium]